MIKIAAVVLLCVTPFAAQTKVLVAKSRTPSLTFDGYRSFCAADRLR